MVKDDTKLTFLGFGTMNGKDGKPFKTREGGVMRLENLIRDINEEMYKKIVDNRSIKEEDARATAKIVGVFSSAAVALGIVLLSSTGNFSKYQKYLVGDILSIRPSEILLLIVCGAVILAVWIVFYNKMLLTSLHPSFAKSRCNRRLFV